MAKKLCKEDINLRIVFSTFKISNYFSTKDVIPECFRSSVVYKFVCTGCNSSYVGRTHVYYNTRSEEHLATDKTSSIFKHLSKYPQCKLANDFMSFSILDHANNDYELALKEAMHIKWEKPNLNGQKRHEIISLTI